MRRPFVQPYVDTTDTAIGTDAAPIPASTQWHRAHGRPSRKDKAVSQQYLTPQEENAIVDYALRMCRDGYPVPVKFLRSLALAIRRHRSSLFQTSSTDDSLRLPGKNWPQGFYKRHPELKARKVKALDWSRHERSIYDKVREWFSIIGKELSQPTIVAENVYNMDETGVLLSVLNSLKVLVSRDELRNYRGTGVQRTLITAIECISGDGRSLAPLIIWPAATHRSTWTAHPTPGWHFACSKTGYTNTEISLYWVKHVFDPLTKARADGKPRILISDGFDTHESLEVLTFCFENNIILCRLPSHTSHKLQPCDVGVFGPLKSAYRENVERLYRGGANTIGKQHFTLLYSRARVDAFTPRNVRSAWSRAGLYPFNPDGVLRHIPQPAAVEQQTQVTEVAVSPRLATFDLPICTPTTSCSLSLLGKRFEGRLNDDSKIYVQKVTKAAERAFVDRALLFDENKLLFEQNNEKTVRQSMNPIVVGNAKVMRYEDIVEARRKRDKKEESKNRKAARGERKRKESGAQMGMHSILQEIDGGQREIEMMGLARHCHILHFER